MISRGLCAVGWHRWEKLSGIETEERGTDQRVIQVKRCRRRGCTGRKVIGILTGWVGATRGATRAARRDLTRRVSGKRGITR